MKVAACRIKCTDLTKDAIKIQATFFSHKKNIEIEENFKKTINGTEKVLRMWQQRDLTLEGKIVIYLQSIDFIKICIFSSNFTNSWWSYYHYTANPKGIPIKLQQCKN